MFILFQFYRHLLFEVAGRCLTPVFVLLLSSSVALTEISPTVKISNLSEDFQNSDLVAQKYQDGEGSLWGHLKTVSDFAELRGLNAEFIERDKSRTLSLKPASNDVRWAYVSIKPQHGVWNLSQYQFVNAEISNCGETTVDVVLFVVGAGSWSAARADVRLLPGESKRLECNLRAHFDSSAPKIDPNRIEKIQIMLINGKIQDHIEVRSLVPCGTAAAWIPPKGRIEVPKLENTPPAPGHRVLFRLNDEPNPELYSVLYLPEDWHPNGRFPVVVEYPGNIWYSGCYSTGRPEQCLIGYGMTKGRGAIWVSLPFIKEGKIAEHGWQDEPDHTADYCVRVLEEIFKKFGGDQSNVVLTGFSRGAIACGFIGLRNDRIAPLWKGMHMCQHWDGDGGGANRLSALERAKRFKGVSVFHTDNDSPILREFQEEAKIPAFYAKSGLGAHDSAMFLDDRPSTLELRQWFWNLIQNEGNRDK